MARLTDKQREDIRNALLLGDSQYKVSQDFEVSSATVNKIYKSIAEDELNKVKDIVKDEIAIKSVLSEQSESFVKAFDSKVNDEIRRRGLVFGGVEKALKKMTEIIEHGRVEEKINIGDGMQRFEERKINTSDIKNALDGYDRAAITLELAPRHSSQNINIQNTNATQNISELTIEEAKREAELLGVPLSALTH